MNSRDVVTFARASFKKKFSAQQIADKLTKVGQLRFPTMCYTMESPL